MAPDGSRSTSPIVQDAGIKGERRMTDANPQQKDVAWTPGARLVEYRCDGPDGPGTGTKHVAVLMLPGVGVKEDGSWSTDWKDATVFPTTKAAISAKHRFNLSRVDMVHIIGEGPSEHYDIVMPLGEND